MNRNNNIENSFSEKFDPKSIKNEGWNDPSDGIWENIEQDLYQDEKSSFGFLHFILASLLLMSLIFVGYLYFQNLGLKNSISESQQRNEAIAMNSKIITTSKNSNETIDKVINGQNLYSEDNIQTIPENNKALNVELRNSNQYNYDPSDVKEEEEKTTAPVNMLMENVNLSDELESKNQIDKPNTIPDSDDFNLVGKNKEVFIQTINNRLQYLEYQREVEAPKNIDLVNENKYRRPFISILSNAGIGVLKTQGSQETALTELIDKEYGNCGLGLDFLYTIPISKSFDLSMGLGIESANFSTEYDIILPYDTEDETLEGDSGFIDFEHSLPTAFGNTETALRLSRVRATGVLDEPNVGLDFNTNHNFVSIALPIGIKYRLGGNRSHFNIGLNARPSYIFNAESSIKSVYSHHSDIDAINNESISSYSGIQDLNLSVGIDVGYHLFFTEKSGLQININYQSYLFDFYNADEFSSSVRKAGVSIGYIYSL